MEVRSPSSARADRFTKRRLYQEVGVFTYWIVEGDARRIEVWTPDARRPAVERTAVTWQPPGATESLTIRLGEPFEPV